MNSSFPLILLLFAMPAQEPGQELTQRSWERFSRRHDRDGDGRVTREEFPRRFLFRTLDSNRDGVITEEDLGGNSRTEPGESEQSSPITPKGTSEEQRREGLALFEEEVYPILELSCLDCHSSEGRRIRADLELDSLAGMLRGGISGPALDPGDPDRSLIVEAVRYQDQQVAMPPDGPLDQDEVRAIERWVALGAPWPGVEPAAPASAERPSSSIDLEAGRQWWSLQPLADPRPPEVEDERWPHSDIDRFVLSRLEEAGLSPVKDAEREDWLRRVTFDLTGLPPTPLELEEFRKDRQDGAHERVVMRLLDSPRHAERMARHWLDVARYAESSGREADMIYPHAWRYRDWVVEAFEQNLPHDEFLLQQLAGDLLSAEDPDAWARQHIATGYLVLGPKNHRERNPLQFTYDLADEQIDAISQGVLGMTFACARCHDHKFDPISSEDYYALAGIFTSTRPLYGTIDTSGNRRPTKLIGLPEEADLPNGPTMPRAVRSFLERVSSRTGSMLDEGMAPSMVPGGRTMRMSDDPVQAAQQRRFAQDAERVSGDLLSRFGEDGAALASNRLAMGVSERRGSDARFLARGELEAQGERVPRGVPAVFGDEPIRIEEGSGRLELAHWITSPENPLTARVWVNRVWSWFFGEGLVGTPDNFGVSGDLPTHPELLDHLAHQFIEDGWSTRELVRRIVLSRTYRLAAKGDSRSEKVDPEVSLLWRMPDRRLEAEALRDAMLFAAGTLELERPVGSPAGVLEGRPRREEMIQQLTRESDARSLYLPILRDRVPHALECFDAADPSFVVGEREETIVPTQALYLMNDEAVTDAADALARRITREEEKDGARIDLAFQLVLSRDPTSAEKRAVKSFLEDFEELIEEEGKVRRIERTTWSAFCQSLFQTAEFRYRG